MSQRHIKTWGVFITVFNDKNLHRGIQSVEDVMEPCESIEIKPNPVKGISAQEIAEVEGISGETARRRLNTFLEEGLITEAEKPWGGKRNYYRPAVSPKNIYRVLENI